MSQVGMLLLMFYKNKLGVKTLKRVFKFLFFLGLVFTTSLTFYMEVVNGVYTGSLWNFRLSFGGIIERSNFLLLIANLIWALLFIWLTIFTCLFLITVLCKSVLLGKKWWFYLTIVLITLLILFVLLILFYTTSYVDWLVLFLEIDINKLRRL